MTLYAVFAELLPKIIQMLEDKEIIVGDAVVFECLVNMDTSTVKWFHDRHEICDHPRYCLLHDGKTHRLTITDTHISDAGDVTVKVENSSSTASLSVLGKCLYFIVNFY